MNILGKNSHAMIYWHFKKISIPFLKNNYKKLQNVQSVTTLFLFLFLPSYFIVNKCIIITKCRSYLSCITFFFLQNSLKNMFFLSREFLLSFFLYCFHVGVTGVYYLFGIKCRVFAPWYEWTNASYHILCIITF